MSCRARRTKPATVLDISVWNAARTKMEVSGYEIDANAHAIRTPSFICNVTLFTTRISLTVSFFR